MDSLIHSQRQNTGVRPHQIIFEKENTENTYITWEEKMKPRINLDDGITTEEYQAMASRWDEMLSLAEEIIWQCYLNPNSEDIMSEVDSSRYPIPYRELLCGGCILWLYPSGQKTSAIQH